MFAVIRACVYTVGCFICCVSVSLFVCSLLCVFTAVLRACLVWCVRVYCVVTCDYCVVSGVSCGRGAGTVARTVYYSHYSHTESQWLAQTEVTEMALILTISPRFHRRRAGRPGSSLLGQQDPQQRVGRTRRMSRESGTVLAPGSAPGGTFSGW